MRKIDNPLTFEPRKSKINRPKTKSFGYQILGFGSGAGGGPYQISYLVIAGGGGGGSGQNFPGKRIGGGGGAGGYRNSYATKSSGGGGSTETPITIGAGVVLTVSIDFYSSLTAYSATFFYSLRDSTSLSTAASSAFYVDFSLLSASTFA